MFVVRCSTKVDKKPKEIFRLHIDMRFLMRKRTKSVFSWNVQCTMMNFAMHVFTAGTAKETRTFVLFT